MSEEQTVDENIEAEVIDAEGGTASGAGDPVSDKGTGWGDDWRTKIAGEDAKVLTRLERYTDLPSVIKAGLEAQDTLRSTRANKLPDNPTEDQIKDFREQWGIPHEPTGYEINGLDDDDKALFGDYITSMHSANASQAQIQSGIDAMKRLAEAEDESFATKDAEDTQRSVEFLKENWGPDFRANINAAKSFLSQLPESMRDSFATARLSDGTAIFNSPEMMMVFADISRKLNPAATVAPNSSNPMLTITDEIKTIKEVMATSPSKYWKDQDMQDRFRQLLDAQQKMGGQA